MFLVQLYFMLPVSSPSNRLFFPLAPLFLLMWQQGVIQSLTRDQTIALGLGLSHQTCESNSPTLREETFLLSKKEVFAQRRKCTSPALCVLRGPQPHSMMDVNGTLESQCIQHCIDYCGNVHSTKVQNTVTLHLHCLI